MTVPQHTSGYICPQCGPTTQTDEEHTQSHHTLDGLLGRAADKANPLTSTERTDEQLAELRAATVTDLRHHHHGLKDVELTCDACDSRRTCPFAMYAYNTDGDCLALK